MLMGIAMWISIVFLATWIGPTGRRRIVGFGLLADISTHIILQTLFSGTGEERVGMLFGGILVNITMHAYRHFKGYEKLTSQGWQRYAGAWT